MKNRISISIVLALLPSIMLSQQSIEWGTYFGGEEVDYSANLVSTSDGGFYLIGNTSSTTNIATVGAHDMEHGSDVGEGFLAKFSSDGSLSWCTYIGGNEDEDLINLRIDNSGNVVIGGRTRSDQNISSIGALQENYSDGADAFFMCFNPNGERLWGTYLGGEGDDFLKDFTLDSSNNVIAVGQTTSEEMGFGTVYQPEIFNTTQPDGFIAKFNATTLEWFSYYGGPELDISSIVDVNNNNEIMIVGFSYSETNMTTAGAYKEEKTDNGEIVVAKFDATGNIIWGTYWGGFSMNLARGSLDSNGDLVFCGRAVQDENITTVGAHNEIFSGEELGYIAKFSDVGFPIWCTYTGGSNGDLDFIISLEMDEDDNIYVGGRTNYLEGIGTANTLVPSVVDTDVYAYGWLTKFGPDGIRDWGTYLPCIENGGATTAILFREGSIILTVNTSCQNEIVLTDGLDTSYGGGSDTYIFKLDLGTAVEESELGSINIFPNPITGDRIMVNVGEHSCSAYAIHDATGRTLVNEKLNGVGKQFQIDISSFSSGVYLLRFYIGKQIVTHKAVVE